MYKRHPLKHTTNKIHTKQEGRRRVLGGRVEQRRRAEDSFGRYRVPRECVEGQGDALLAPPPPRVVTSGPMPL